MKMNPSLFLLTVGLLLTACSATADVTDPVAVPMTARTGATEVGSVTATAVVKDEPQSADEEDDSALRFLENVPPAGLWSWEVLESTSECDEGLTITLAGLDPVPVTMALSEDAITMTLTLPEGTVILTQVSVNTEGELRTSKYVGARAVLDFEVVFELDFNLDRHGLLHGFSGNPDQECKIVQPFSAEYIGK